MNTLSVLLTRYGFLFLALLQLSQRLPENVDPTRNNITVIRLGTIVEVIAAIYILFYGDMTNRLAINNQAVGGSLSIGLIILSNILSLSIFHSCISCNCNTPIFLMNNLYSFRPKRYGFFI